MTSLLIFQLQAKTFVVVYTLHAANKFLMASDLQPTLQLKDVYDIAQSVGEAFQLLIKRFGDSSFVDLVNTVVNVLEHLETYVQDNQKLQAQLCKLLLDNDKLLKENETLRTESQKNTVSSLAINLLAAIISAPPTPKQGCANSDSLHKVVVLTWCIPLPGNLGIYGGGEDGEAPIGNAAGECQRGEQGTHETNRGHPTSHSHEREAGQFG